MTDIRYPSELETDHPEESVEGGCWRPVNQLCETFHPCRRSTRRILRRELLVHCASGLFQSKVSGEVLSSWVKTVGLHWDQWRTGCRSSWLWYTVDCEQFLGRLAASMKKWRMDCAGISQHCHSLSQRHGYFQQTSWAHMWELCILSCLRSCLIWPLTEAGGELQDFQGIKNKPFAGIERY